MTTALLVQYMRQRFREEALAAPDSSMALRADLMAFSDPAAQQMILQMTPQEKALLDGILSKFPPGSCETIGARVLFQDSYLRRWHLGREANVVLLGAGMDTMSNRFADQPNLKFWELDLPAAQQDKLRRLGGAQPNTTYLSCDFLTEDPFAVLRAALDPQLPTLYVWMGVAMYLPLTAVKAMLSRAAAALSPGDLFLMDYPQPPDESDAQVAAALEALRKAGEPVKFSAQNIRALAVEHDLEVLRDEPWGAFMRNAYSFRVAPERWAQLSFCSLTRG